MDSELSFDEHINIKIYTANKIVGISDDLIDI